MTAADLARIPQVLRPFLGRLYYLGAKWDLHNPTPPGPIDCSGFVRWGYFRALGLEIPDGSFAQFAVTDACKDPLPGDLGFFRGQNGTVDHVGVVADAQDMIEARGLPYSKVILRPRAKWEAWPHFTGYRRLRAVHING